MKNETKQTIAVIVFFTFLAYALAAVAKRLNRTTGKEAGTAMLWVLLGFVIGGYWMYKHLTCESCQGRWSNIKRRLGMRLIE